MKRYTQFGISTHRKHIRQPAQLRYTRTIQRCVPPYPPFSLICGLVAFRDRLVRFCYPSMKTCCDQQADKAISSIKPAHIQEVKKLPNPADVIKMVFDCILLLFHLPVSGYA